MHMLCCHLENNSCKLLNLRTIDGDSAYTLFVDAAIHVRTNANASAILIEEGLNNCFKESFAESHRRHIFMFSDSVTTGKGTFIFPLSWVLPSPITRES